jgi:hypothetical protein
MWCLLSEPMRWLSSIGNNSFLEDYGRAIHPDLAPARAVGGSRREGILRLGACALSSRSNRSRPLTTSGQALWHMIAATDRSSRAWVDCPTRRPSARCNPSKRIGGSNSPVSLHSLNNNSKHGLLNGSQI